MLYIKGRRQRREHSRDQHLLREFILKVGSRNAESEAVIVIQM